MKKRDLTVKFFKSLADHKKVITIIFCVKNGMLVFVHRHRLAKCTEKTNSRTEPYGQNNKKKRDQVFPGPVRCLLNWLVFLKEIDLRSFYLPAVGRPFS